MENTLSLKERVGSYYLSLKRKIAYNYSVFNRYLDVKIYKKMKLRFMDITKYYIEVDQDIIPLDVLFNELDKLELDSDFSVYTNVNERLKNNVTQVRYYFQMFLSSGHENFISPQEVWLYLLDEYFRLYKIREMIVYSPITADGSYKLRVLNPLLNRIENFITLVGKIEEV